MPGSNAQQQFHGGNINALRVLCAAGAKILLHVPAERLKEAFDRLDKAVFNADRYA